MSINKEKFRPSARLLSTIGENLIKDNYAAVVELVKNAYDADATHVSVTFEIANGKLLLTIEDDGIGMSPDTIIQKWLVPSTNDKCIRRISKKGRYMQGEKGIGRFSAAILGEKLYLYTIHDGLASSIAINWEDFSETKYLDEVEVELETVASKKKNGTKFVIECSDTSKWWTEDNIEYLEKEFRKMLTPVETKSDDEFKISLIFKKFNIKKYNDVKIEIEPYPLLNYFNYRIYGKVLGNGQSEMYFEYRKKDEIIKEDVSRKIEIKKGLQYCGLIEFDFKVFERDGKNLEECYKNDPYISTSLDSMNVTEIKRLLNKICGISIYKNHFRIRPYGDEDYDWMELDKKRVQDPSYRIGFNQISGIINIESEEKSGLVEKSARDGLREDAYYYGLKSIVSSIIEILELKRKMLKNSIEKENMELVINNEDLKEKITEAAQQAGVEEQIIDQFEKIIDDDSKIKDEKLGQLNQNISKYEGQATLGKIMDLIMHEIRKPLMWFKTQPTTIMKTFERYQKSHNEKDLEKIVELIKASQLQASLITDFFKKIDILATRSQEEKETFNIYNVLNDSLGIFDSLLTNNGIEVTLNCNKDILFYGWKKDIVIAVANIIENSIYWISNYDRKEKLISIDVMENKDDIMISIADTGIGISKEFLEDDSLFKPGMTSKPNGTGIGLAIVGRCIERNHGKVEASNTSQGALLKITLHKLEEK